MGSVLDVFRDPPLVDEFAVSYTKPFTGGFTGGPPCNPQLDDIAGNNAYFANLCVGSFNLNPALQAQPGHAFMGRLVNTVGESLTCPINTWTRIPFTSFEVNDTKFVPLPVGGPYDRIQMPTYTLPDVLITFFADISGSGPASMYMGVMDSTNNILMAVTVNPTIGFTMNATVNCATSSILSLVVYPLTTPFVLDGSASAFWPTFECFAIGQL